MRYNKALEYFESFIICKVCYASFLCQNLAQKIK